jgi:ubiquinone/menaquinone biosynthesis C-methylase UbiE
MTSDLFDGTAAYYRRYRAGYPDAIFAKIVEHFKLDDRSRILDLGCGTGQLAIPFAKRHIAVIAVDPNVDMLTEGMRSELRAGVRGVSWQRGDDRNLECLNLPPLSVCTMGASFHWTDREKLAEKLDRMIMPDGGIALVSGESVWSASSTAWQTIAKDVIVEFLGERRRAGAGVYSDPVERHEDILARSAFGSVVELTFEWQRSLTAEDIVGLQLSTSYASPSQLGPKLEAFRSELRERLRQTNPSDLFDDVIKTQLILATRRSHPT